jgi:central glycolytic genes regulator
MKDIIELQKKIIPEMIEILEKRYNILRNVLHNQPIGRRTLANNLNLGERIIRTEVNILKEQGLLEVKSMGMSVTGEGKNVIDRLKDFIYEIKGLSDLERLLEKKLGIKKVHIVPGNSDKDELILKDIGKKASLVIKDIIKDNSIIGVTGGTTMAQIAEAMPSGKGDKNILVLPARGGLGKYLETQANNVAARFAEKLGGSYKLLHVPDNISKETLETLLQVPDIKETVEMIKNMDILVFGLGRAEDMARRRKLSSDLIEKLKEKGAVAEAFGHYFNTKGEIIWKSNTVGLSLVDFEKVSNVIGVAGGGRKAEAIIAISSLKKDMTLVTDEGAARKIIEIIEKAT